MVRRKPCRIRISRKSMQKLIRMSAETKIPVRTLMNLAIDQYLQRINRRKQLQRMKKGYIAMGSINRALANEAAFSDEQQFFTYEHFLSESE